MKNAVGLALGFFDSVHCGHRIIIEKLKQAATQLKIKPIVSTFTDNFSKGDKLVYTLCERKSILSKLSISDILEFDFFPEFKNLTPSEFLNFLIKEHNIKYIICGYDYRFGQGGSGNCDTLAEFSSQHDIKLEIVDKLSYDGERISTSKIKEFLHLGEIENANKLLCGNFFASGKVEKGRGEGRINLIPTANLAISPKKLLPKNGVYATKTQIMGKLWHSVTNIGQKPTYDDSSFTVETFIDGFAGDIYNQEIKVFFYKHLRETQKFADKEQLRNQINQDMTISKSIAIGRDLC